MRAHLAAVDGRPATGLSAVAGQPANLLMAGNRGPTGAELAGLGLFIAAAFIVPFVGGLVLDGLLHTSPVFVFTGLVVGIGAAVAGLYQRLKRYL